MRVLRALGGVVLWLLASVLLLLAVVLGITIVLLPVGILLGFAALRLYGWGFRLFLPRSRDVEKHVKKQARRWWRGVREAVR